MINTIFQSNLLIEPCSEDEGVGGSVSELPFAFDKGFPHNPGFPSKEAFENVENGCSCGIGPLRLLLETLKNARNVILVSCDGILKKDLIMRKIQ